MVVDNTPERSFSLLLSELARRGGHHRMRAFAEMRRRQHCIQRRFDRPGRIGEEIGNAGERLVGAGVEHMQNCADEQGMAGLFQ